MAEVLDSPDTIIPPAKPASKQPNDPFIAMLYNDIGVVLGEDGSLSKKDKVKVEPIAPVVGMMTAGELSGYAAAERKEKADAAAKVDAPAVAVVPDPPKPAEPPKPATPPEAPAAPAPAPTIEVVKTRPLDALVRETVDKALQSKLPQPTVEAPPKVETPEWEASLDEIQKDELAFARYASQKMPDKYKDLPAKITKYFKDADEAYDRLRKENPERTFDAKDEDWQRFIQDNRPELSAMDRRKLERLQIRDEVIAEEDTRFKEHTSKLERQVHELRVKPAVDNSIKEFRKEIESLAGADSPASAVLTRAREAGWDAAIEESPYIAPIVKDVTAQAENLGRTYMELVTGLSGFDQNSPSHKGVVDFLEQDGNYFAANGGAKRIKVEHGMQKSFLTRSQYMAIANQNPVEASKYWTFTDSEVLNRIADNANRAADFLIKKEQEKLKKEQEKWAKAHNPGPVVTKPTTPAPEPKPTNTPKPTPSIAPGAADHTPIVDGRMFSGREWELLTGGKKV